MESKGKDAVIELRNDESNAALKVCDILLPRQIYETLDKHSTSNAKTIPNSQ
jgi:hypothetical protein